MQFFCEVESGGKITELELANGSVFFKCHDCGERVYTSAVVWDDRGDSSWLCKSCKEKQEALLRNKNDLLRNIKFAKSLSKILSVKIDADDMAHFFADARSLDSVIDIDIEFIREYFKDYPPLDEKKQCGQGTTLISTSTAGRKVIRIESDS